MRRHASVLFTDALGLLRDLVPVCNVGVIVAKRLDGSIKMSLGTEVGLGPCDIALDGDQALPRKGAQHPRLFGPCLFWPNSRPSQQQLLSSCYDLA